MIALRGLVWLLVFFSSMIVGFWLVNWLPVGYFGAVALCSCWFECGLVVFLGIVASVIGGA